MHTRLLPSKLMQFYLHSQHPFLIACLWEPALASPFASKAEQNKEWPLFFLIQIQRMFVYVCGCESSITSMSFGSLSYTAIGKSIPSFSKCFLRGQVLLCHKCLLWRVPGGAGEITAQGCGHWNHKANDGSSKCLPLSEPCAGILFEGHLRGPPCSALIPVDKVDRMV